MILHGNARGGGSELAIHLMRTDENEHVSVHDVSGFMSEDVRGAFQEVEALAKGTRCQKPLFSLSLSPPKDANASGKDFEQAIAKAEEALGLSGQPRVIVFHEKGEHRDRHCHVVWSRIDAEQMKAIPMPFNRLKMRDVSRDLFIEHGWDVPRGLINSRERNPLNYTFDQYQQAKRHGEDAHTIKAAIQDAWALSDNRSSLINALGAKGFRLARGDRRGFVTVDHDGEVRSLPKWVGVKTKAVRERLGSEADLPTVDQTQAMIAQDMLGKLGEYTTELKRRNEQRKEDRTIQRRAMVERQRSERALAMKAIEDRQVAETTERQGKFRNGLKGVWDWMRGENKRIKAENEVVAAKSFERDRLERESLVSKQRQQREWLSERQRQLSGKLRQQYEHVQADKTRYAEIKVPPVDDRREAFKRKRLQSEPRSPRRRRDGPKPGI